MSWELIYTAYQLMHKVPPGTRLYAAVRAAAAGDQQAVAYLKGQGWADAADVLLQPGAGDLARQTVEFARQGWANLAGGTPQLWGGPPMGPGGNPGEPRFASFVRWLKRQDWGTWVAVGPKGSGKTTLAVRLAQTWAEEHGYTVDAVGMHPEDVPRWFNVVGTEAFFERIGRLKETLDPPQYPESPDPPGGGRKHTARPRRFSAGELKRLHRRVIIIDEAGLIIGVNAQDRGRFVARTLVQAARHLENHIIFSGQLMRQIPEDLLNADAIFVKKPLGDEHMSDKRDNPMISGIWSAALEAFEKLPQSLYWAGLPRYQSWAYVYSRSRDYFGMMPVKDPRQEAMGQRLEAAELDADAPDENVIDGEVIRGKGGDHGTP